MTAPSPAPRPGLRALLLGTVLLLTAATFARIVVEGGFVYDDGELVVHNPEVREEFTLERAFRPAFWETAYPETGHRIPFYRPLVTTAFHLGWRLSGVEPWGHHAINLAVHLLATAAVFLLLERFLRGALLAAALGALLFGLHPAHVESVAWVSGISDVLATACVLWAWVFLLRGLRTGSWVAFAAGFALHVGGLFAKEVAMFFAPAFLLGWLLLGERGLARSRRWALAAALVLPLFAWYGARVAVFDSWNAGVDRTVVPLLDDTEPWRPIAIRPEFVGHYVRLMVDPSARSPFHVFRPQVPWNDPVLLLHVALGLATFALALLLLAFRDHRRRPYTLGVCVFLLGLTPVLTKPSVLGQFPVSERYLYFSSFGFTLAVASVLALAFARIAHPAGRAVLAGGVALVVLGLGAVAQEYSLIYRTERSFFEAACERSPESAVAHTGMGSVLVKEAEAIGGRDRESARQKLIAAAGHFARVAREIDDQRYLVSFYERNTAFLFEVQSTVLSTDFVPPSERQSQFLIAEAYLKRYEEWLADMESVIQEQRPAYLDIVRHARRAPEYLLTRARIEFGLGHHAQAVALCQEALRVDDNNVAACTTLAEFQSRRAEAIDSLSEKLRLVTSAIAHLRRAKVLDPANRDLDVKLAHELVESGGLRVVLAEQDETARSVGDREIKEATELLQEVLRQQPQHVEAAWDLGRLYWKFGQSARGEEALRFLQNGERLMHGAIRLTEGRPEWLERLAAMYMASQRYYEAQNLLYRYRPNHPDDLRLQGLLVQVLVRAWVSGKVQPDVRRQAEDEIVRLRELSADSWLADRAEALLINGTDVPRMLDAWRRAVKLAKEYGMHPDAIPDLRREAARWFLHVARETHKRAVADAEHLSAEEFSRQIDQAARLYEEGAELVHQDPEFDLDWHELATFLLQAGRPNEARIILERGLGIEKDRDALERMRELLERVKR